MLTALLCLRLPEFSIYSDRIDFFFFYFLLLLLVATHPNPGVYSNVIYGEHVAG